MEAVNGVSEPGDKSGPPPPSPLTGCYLLIVIGEPHCGDHKDIILQKVAKGLLSWDVNNCLVDLEKELAILTEQALEGEEARYGERLIQFASENLVTEILIHPVVSTLVQCMRNLLSSFTRHRHIIHAGYTFANNGSWILQDGTFSLADFSEACQEAEVLRVIRAYENGISMDLHCAPEGDWTRLPKEPFTKGCNVRVNPNDILTAGSPSITNFINYIEPFLIPAELDNILECSDVVGNIRFSRPTLYVFPGGQGDAALFGINGFNMLLDGGFSRKACFWDFVRHLDRLDAVLLTRLNNSNVNGISAVLKRKKQNALYPQIGHFFCNIQERKAILSPDGDKDKDPLLVNLLDEGQEIITNLRHLNLTPQVCYRDSEPINLYHKVGHGTLDMYVLSPAKDSKEVREFLQKWNNNDQKLFATTKSKEFVFPLQNLVSICALLVWQPANADDTITRILFPGSSPQNKIFEGLDRIKNLEFIKYPVCSEKTLTPASVIKSKAKESILEKIIPTEKKISIDNKKEKPKQPEKTADDTINENDLKNGDVNGVQTEKIVKKSDSVESEKSVSKTSKRIIENGDRFKPKPKIEAKAKLRSDSQQRKVKTVDKKPSPTTPKKTVEKTIEETKEPKQKQKASPSSTPAKSAKEASNRKVVESKIKAAPRKEATPPKPTTEKKETVKVERKPISRRPKEATKVPPSPSKKVNGVQKPDTISKRGKLDKEGTTDSSTVSTPSADQESVLKKDISKLTSDELQNLKAQELADLKEEQEAVKEIEAVFRKGEQHDDKPSDFRKIKDLSIDDKLEGEEYLIIEKTEIVQNSEQDKDTKEEETQKLVRDSEESEKRKETAAEIEKKEIEEKREEIKEQIQAITEEAEKQVKEEQHVEIISKELSVTSPEEKIDLSTDKKTTEKDEDIKEPAPESVPDEKGSANIESGATTTAPTLPEDERIPLDEIKEDNGDQIEEKHVKEDTKEKDVPVIQLPPKTFEEISKLPPVVGIRLDKQTHIRDIVKTPDEVADLPVHEEVDIVHYDDFGTPVSKVDHKETDDAKKKEKPDEKEKDFDKDDKKDDPKDKGKELIETIKVEEKTTSETEKVVKEVEKKEEELKVEKIQEISVDEKELSKDKLEDKDKPEKDEAQTDKPGRESPVIPSEEPTQKTGEHLKKDEKLAESPVEETPKEVEIIEKSEFEVKEKIEEEKFDTKQLPEIPKHDISSQEETEEPSGLKHESVEIEKIKETKEDIEKLDEKLQKLKEQVDYQEIITVDHKIEKPEHAEPVIISADSKPETPTVEDKTHFEDKPELGRKSPKEREEDVAKIVASVAEVLKSDAPLEEFEGKIPFSIPCKSYTTELRETHITTVDSPITDESKAIKDKQVEPVTEEPIDTKSVVCSFIENEQKIAEIHETKLESKTREDSKETLQAASEVIPKQAQPEEATIEEKHETEDTDGGAVHRMLVTASSEDGGEEIEICPAGTITFSKSSESSGRSSPDVLSQKVSQKSSVAETSSDATVVIKSIKDVHSATDSGIEEYGKDDIQTDKEQIEKSDIKVDMDISKVTSDKEIYEENEKQTPEVEIKKEDKPEAPLKEIEETTKEIHDEEIELLSKKKDTTQLIEDKTDTIVEEISEQAETKSIESTNKEIVAAKITDVLLTKEDHSSDKAEEVVEAIKGKVDETVEKADETIKSVQEQKNEIAQKIDVLDKPIDKVKDDILETTKETVKVITEKISERTEDTVKHVPDVSTDLPEVTKTVESKKDEALDKAKEIIEGTESKTEKEGAKADTILELAHEKKDEINKKADDLGKSTDQVSKDAVESAKETKKAVEEKIDEITANGLEAVKEGIDAALTDATETIKSTKDGILEKTEQVAEDVETKVEEFIQETKETVKSIHDKKDETTDKTIDLVKSAEIIKEDALKTVEKIEKVAEKEIVEKTEAITKDIENTKKEVVAPLSEIAEKIESEKEDIVDKVEAIGKSIETKTEGATETLESVLEPIQAKKNEVVKKIDDIKDSVEKVAEDALKTVEETEQKMDQKIEDVPKSIDSAVEGLDYVLTDKTETIKSEKEDVLEKTEEVVKSADTKAEETTQHVEKISESVHDKKDEVVDKLQDVSKSATEAKENVLKAVEVTKKDVKEEIDEKAEDAVNDIESTIKKIDVDLKETKEIVEAKKNDIADKVDEVVKSTESKADDISKKIEVTASSVQDKKDEITEKIDGLKESAEKIGEDSMEKLKETEKAVSQKISEKTDVIAEHIESSTKEIGKALTELTDMAEQKKDEIISKVDETVKSKTEEILETIQDKKDVAAEKIGDISKSAEEMKEDVSKVVKETEKTIEKEISQKTEAIAEGVESITKKVSGFLTGITGAIETKKDEILNVVEETIKSAESKADEIVEKVKETKELVEDKKDEILKTTDETIKSLEDKASEALQAAESKIGDGIEKGKKGGEDITKTIESKTDEIHDSGKKVLEDIDSKIKQTESAVADKIDDVKKETAKTMEEFKEASIDMVKDKLEEAKQTEAVIAEKTMTEIKGIESKLEEVSNELKIKGQDFKDDIEDKLVTEKEEIQEKLDDTKDTLSKKTVLSEIKEPIKEVFSGASLLTDDKETDKQSVLVNGIDDISPTEQDPSKQRGEKILEADKKEETRLVEKTKEIIEKVVDKGVSEVQEIVDGVKDATDKKEDKLVEDHKTDVPKDKLESDIKEKEAAKDRKKDEKVSDVDKPKTSLGGFLDDVVNDIGKGIDAAVDGIKETVDQIKKDIDSIVSHDDEKHKEKDKTDPSVDEKKDSKDTDEKEESLDKSTKETAVEDGLPTSEVVSDSQKSDKVVEKSSTPLPDTKDTTTTTTATSETEDKKLEPSKEEKVHEAKDKEDQKSLELKTDKDIEKSDAKLEQDSTDKPMEKEESDKTSSSPKEVEEVQKPTTDEKNAESKLETEKVTPSKSSPSPPTGTTPEIVKKAEEPTSSQLKEDRDAEKSTIETKDSVSVAEAQEKPIFDSKDSVQIKEEKIETLAVSDTSERKSSGRTTPDSIVKEVIPSGKSSPTILVTEITKTEDPKDSKEIQVIGKPDESIVEKIEHDIESIIDKGVKDVTEIVSEAKEAVTSIFKDSELKKEEKFLEEAAHSIEQEFDKVSDMSKSIIFEKCDLASKKDGSKESETSKASDKIEESIDEIIKHAGAKDTDIEDVTEVVSEIKDVVTSVLEDDESKKEEKKGVEKSPQHHEKDGSISPLSTAEDKHLEQSIQKIEETFNKITDMSKSIVFEKCGSITKKDAEKFLESSAHSIEEEFEKVSDMSKSIVFEKCVSPTKKEAEKVLEQSAHSIEEEYEKVSDMSKSIVFEKCVSPTKKEAAKTLEESAHSIKDEFEEVTDKSKTMAHAKDDTSSKSVTSDETEITKTDKEDSKGTLPLKDKDKTADKKENDSLDSGVVVESESKLESTTEKEESIAGPSTTLKEPSSGLKLGSSDDLHLSGKSTPDIADVEKIKESQEIQKHEQQHIPGSSTPPTVPVSPIIKESSSSAQTHAKKSTEPATITTIKESELRSSTPASDDYEIGASTHSDVSSELISRAPHLLEDSERMASEDDGDDDDVPGSPTSMTSQVPHSGSSSRYDFDDGIKTDPMNTSFYGALPDEPEPKKSSTESDLDFEKAKAEHRQTRGDTLGEASSSYLYEITKAKFTTGSTSDDCDNTKLDQINKNGQTKTDNVMTSSFIGELPTSDEKDPVKTWGKPLGLPSPAPPTDNRGTPKKERKLPANVTAKNKLNDDKKRSESPSKYNKKKQVPVYVDLTYVPHHGNAYYAYVDFFKRVRARYYVFSGIEPSREVYNALLEAKQTWEDKDLEVTIIPTYDTDILGYWVAENEELLTKYKIDLSPSASRCTINLQDHETSCSAYRLEF